MNTLIHSRLYPTRLVSWIYAFQFLPPYATRKDQYGKMLHQLKYCWYRMQGFAENGICDETIANNSNFYVITVNDFCLGLNRRNPVSRQLRSVYLDYRKIAREGRRHYSSLRLGGIAKALQDILHMEKILEDHPG